VKTSEQKVTDQLAGFDLEEQFSTNFANTINILMMRYQMLAEQRYKPGIRFRDSVFALTSLIQNLPPKGQEFLKSQYEYFRTKGLNNQEFYDYLNHNSTSIEEIYAVLDDIFDTLHSWIWTNVLELHWNKKPKYTKPAGQL
jgi:hypothetical protein